MAAWNPIAIAPGVTRVDCYWGYYLEGRKDALVAAGLAKESWFADWRQRDKAGRTIRKKSLIDRGQLIETKRPERGVCSIRVIRERRSLFYQRDPECQRWLRDTLAWTHSDIATRGANWASAGMRAEVDELYRPAPAR